MFKTKFRSFWRLNSWGDDWDFSYFRQFDRYRWENQYSRSIRRSRSGDWCGEKPVRKYWFLSWGTGFEIMFRFLITGAIFIGVISRCRHSWSRFLPTQFQIRIFQTQSRPRIFQTQSRIWFFLNSNPNPDHEFSKRNPEIWNFNLDPSPNPEFRDRDFVGI